MLFRSTGADIRRGWRTLDASHEIRALAVDDDDSGSKVWFYAAPARMLMSVDKNGSGLGRLRSRAARSAARRLDARDATGRLIGAEGGKLASLERNAFIDWR